MFLGNSMFDDKGLVIVSKDGCKYCDLARVFLSQKKVNYTVLEQSDVDIDDVKKWTNHKTFPFIFWNREFIGGYDELRLRFSTGELPKKMGLTVEHCDF